MERRSDCLSHGISADPDFNFKFQKGPKGFALSLPFRGSSLSIIHYNRLLFNSSQFFNAMYILSHSPAPSSCLRLQPKKRTPGRMISICAIVVLSCPSACFLTGPETAYFSSSRAYSTPREAAYPMISWQLFFLSLECQSPWGSVSSLQETVPYLAWNVSVSAAKVL